MADEPILKQLEAVYLRGKYGRVIFMCDDLMANPAHEHLRPYLLFWKGSALAAGDTAYSGQAITCYREGIQAAGKDRAIKARLIAGLTAIYGRAGDCDAFPRLLQSFERTAGGGGPAAQMWGTFVWQNYGTALVNAFRYAEAVTAFTRGAEVAHQFSIPEMEGKCYHDLSWAQVLQGNLPETAAAMARARDLWSEEQWGHKKRNVEAEYLLAMGDPNGAIQQVQAALAHPQIDDTTRADVHFTWAKALLALGCPEEAKEQATQSLDYATKAVHYPVIHKAYRFLQEQGGLSPG
ncbi:MAG TPA: hypothetical protein VGK74_21815 [Symbiobacteriaceae bacterium]